MFRENGERWERKRDGGKRSMRSAVVRCAARRGTPAPAPAAREAAATGIAAHA